DLFIVSGTEVFIDEAVVNRLTFSKLRDEAGSFVVENGKIKATYMQVASLSALSANLGYVSAGALDIGSDGSGGWGYARSSGKWRDANWGWILAQHPAGDMFVDFTLNGCGLVMHHIPGVAASFHLWGPGFDLTNGGLTISQLNVIGTAQISGNAVTVALWASGNGSASVAFDVPAGEYWECVNNATWGPAIEIEGGYTATYGLTNVSSITAYSVLTRTTSNESSTQYFYRIPPLAMASVSGHTAGHHVISCSGQANAPVVLTCMLRKR